MEELYSFTGEGGEQEDNITLATLRRAAASRLRSEDAPSRHFGEQEKPRRDRELKVPIPSA